MQYTLLKPCEKYNRILSLVKDLASGFEEVKVNCNAIEKVEI